MDKTNQIENSITNNELKLYEANWYGVTSCISIICLTIVTCKLINDLIPKF